MPKRNRQLTKTATQTKTSTVTTVAIAALVTLAAAAALGYIAIRYPQIPGKYKKLTAPLTSPYVPGYTPGYTPPGGTPGYTTPGYTPGYSNTINPTATAGCPVSVSASYCSSGWAVCSKQFTVSNLPKSILVKGSGTAVYWYGADGRRYVFPNERTFRSWYPLGGACPTIKVVSDSELWTIPIGGNVTYRPGIKLLKITTDPKVYAVSKGGMLRWLESESIAAALYGTNWKLSVDDVPDSFFTNYTVSGSISNATQYNKTLEAKSAVTIDQDKGLN